LKPYYEHAGITIYHGDCREIVPSLPVAFCWACGHLDDESILAIHLTAGHDVRPFLDLVVTDPPYGMGKAEWDMEIVPVDSWLPLCRSIAPTLVFTGVKGAFDYPKPTWILAWVRLASVQRCGALKGFNNWEPILAYDVPALKNDVVSGGNIPDGDTGDHPTPKPVSMMTRLLTRITGDSILDPFCGSGTTLIAAKNLGKSAIGIEIEEKYCEIAAKRLSQEVFNFEPIGANADSTGERQL